jgi:hypothetical protein
MTLRSVQILVVVLVAIAATAGVAGDETKRLRIDMPEARRSTTPFSVRLVRGKTVEGRLGVAFEAPSRSVGVEVYTTSPARRNRMPSVRCCCCHCVSERPEAWARAESPAARFAAAVFGVLPCATCP